MEEELKDQFQDIEKINFPNDNMRIRLQESKEIIKN